MWQDMLGGIHLGNAVFSLLAGAAVLTLRKGTRLHKWIGYTYATGMLVLNVSALSLYRLNGDFNVFHACALVSLVSLFGGMVPAILRRPAGWLRMHYEFMAWSYVGLVAAAVSETAVRLPSAPFWPAVAIGSVLVLAGGALAVHFLRPRFQRQFDATERTALRRRQAIGGTAQSPR
ncbi:MAG: DUF2306 domain-containing protein [Xanthomonadales bacterium]|nr:DUF2306 domain-containing protein [Xanthomonadales bacterium]